MNRRLVTIDFTECRYIGEVYQEMREAMAWQDWYGENLNALWDILTGLPYEGDDFIIVYSQRYSDAELLRTITGVISVFRRAADTYGMITLVEKRTD